MDLKRFKSLHLLEIIAQDKDSSQRYFSDSLDMSLGLVNKFIKRLVTKGYCKVTSMPGNRIKYILTPAGVVEKTRLTYEYFVSSCQYYKTAVIRLQTFFKGLEQEGARRIVFYGAGELVDVALDSMAGTQLELIGVVDPSMEGKRLAHVGVTTAARLEKMAFDAIVVTAADDHETAIKTIIAAGVAEGKIRFLS